MSAQPSATPSLYYDIPNPEVAVIIMSITFSIEALPYNTIYWAKEKNGLIITGNKFGLKRNEAWKSRKEESRTATQQSVISIWSQILIFDGKNFKSRCVMGKALSFAKCKPVFKTTIAIWDQTND